MIRNRLRQQDRVPQVGRKLACRVRRVEEEGHLEPPKLQRNLELEAAVAQVEVKNRAGGCSVVQASQRGRGICAGPHNFRAGPPERRADFERCEIVVFDQQYSVAGKR